MKKITECDIEKLIDVYEFITLELAERPNLIRISSNLAEIINILAEENLNEIDNKATLNEFNINNKITFNHLNSIKRRIDKHKIYFSKVNLLYRRFDTEGSNKSLSVFQKLYNIYEEELLHSENKPSLIFLSIIEKVKQQIITSDNYLTIPDEELELCISIIVVDAFIRCEIFENPEGYEYVIT